MTSERCGLTFTFATDRGQAYRVALDGAGGEHLEGTLALPYTPQTWAAVMRALEALFGSMLEQLMTGRIRVPVKGR